MAQQRRFPWWLPVAAFVVVPLAEIYVLIQVGHVIGAWWTVLLLLADSLVGGWLVVHEGGRAWQALQEALAQRRMPHRELADGALILVGGALMLTPGFLTDALGILCILPFTRPLARGVLARVVSRRLLGGGAPAAYSKDPGTQHRPGPDVVQGDVVE